MSQAGTLDLEQTNPQIPTSFTTDNGVAIPIANNLEILGTYVLASSTPVETTGVGKTVTVQVQLSDDALVSDVNNAGISSFDSTAFTVDANGFVTLNGGGIATTDIMVDAFTPPGTNPVTPLAGVITLTGGQVAAGVVGTNVIRTNSTAPNEGIIEIQRSTVAGSATPEKNGVAHFNSAEFTVDSNGFVSLAGGGLAIDSIGVQTGTSPVVATASGLVTINGAVVAAGTNPVRSDGTGPNTLALEVQISQAIAATDATKIGLSNFDSAAFDVDANGFVQLNGGGIAATSFDVQANTAPGTDPVVPTAAGAVTVNGAVVANHSVVLETRSRAANAYNLEVQYSTAVAATDGTKSGVAHFNSTQFSVDASGFVQLAGGGLAIDSIGTQTGTNPIVPDAAGLVTINGAVVAAGTNPLRSNGTGANTMALEVQISQALAATDATKIGLSNFDSTSFAVDANGFVTSLGGGFTWSDVSGAFSPLKNNGYFITATATGTLPAGPAQGDTIKFFVDHASQVLTIDAPGTQIIRLGSLVTSAGGTAVSTAQGDSVELVYRSSDTCWCAIAGFTGTWVIS